MKKLVMFVLVVMAFLMVQGCERDSQIASKNLSRAAEMFQIKRRVVFYNGITGGYMLSVEGLCAIKADRADNQLELTCKTGPESFKKHFLGLSDNVTYFVEQLNSANTDVFHYKVYFKPASIIPDVDLITK
jgi:hypothetical protein